MPEPMLAGADTDCGSAHLPFEQLVGHLADEFQDGHFSAPRYLSTMLIWLTKSEKPRSDSCHNTALSP
jgi:hypothetical protein